MADITISDLELAPALTDDMVLPVENTTDTYAATLAMLRRLINKTFVEVENADFNALTDDGFYQCTGTPTNSPVAGAINWTLQVSAESGVVVQRAFSLDDNFSNIYIRRWNGVTWTDWLSNTVTTDTAQTISGVKTFKGVVTAELETINFIAKNPTMDVNETPSANKYVGYDFRDKNNVRIGYIGISQDTNGTFKYEFKKLGNYTNKILGITPPANSIRNEIVTAEWVNTKLGGFANTNASNFTATGKQNVVGWVGINTSSSIARSLNTEYTATRNCWIYHDENGNNTSLFYVNGVVVYQTVSHAGVTSAKGSALVFVEKGQTWKAENGSSVTEFGTLGG